MRKSSSAYHRGGQVLLITCVRQCIPLPIVYSNTSLGVVIAALAESHKEGDDGDRVLRRPRIESSPVIPAQLIGTAESVEAGSGKRWSYW
jgi:hypothetical protein